MRSLTNLSKKSGRTAIGIMFGKAYPVPTPRPRKRYSMGREGDTSSDTPAPTQPTIDKTVPTGKE